MIQSFRAAVATDVPFIVELLREFYAKSGDIYRIPFHGPSARKTIERVMEHGICLVGPTSVAGAMIRPGLYNESAFMAHVTFWYFRNAREITIFEALMKECRRAGATHIIASSQFPKNAITPWYEKFGLRKAEVSHLLAF